MEFDVQRPHKRWRQYAALAGTYLMWFDDDWAYSFPGWVIYMHNLSPQQSYV
jgi:hypothetical protein